MFMSASSHPKVAYLNHPRVFVSQVLHVIITQIKTFLGTLVEVFTDTVTREGGRHLHSGTPRCRKGRELRFRSGKITIHHHSNKNN